MNRAATGKASLMGASHGLLPLAVSLDGDTTSGRLVWTGILLAVATVLATLLAFAAGRRADDQYARHHLRRAIAFTVFFVALVAIAILWRPFDGRIGLVIGFVTAGLAFAMQEVIGAVAGWYNILLGRIYRIGDRVEVGGVRGDVIDVTPLRTKLLEIGDERGESSPVKGRQYTGRVVTVSNKTTFTQPVFNFSATFEYIWEELSVPVAHGGDWRGAERIVREEANRVSRTEGAREALDEMLRRYPVPRRELEPRVFVRATDNWTELAARFLVPVRTARSVKDDLTRRILDRFAENGIEVASETLDVSLEEPEAARKSPR